MAADRQGGGPSRRTLLRAGLLLPLSTGPLAACTADPAPGPPPPPDPDIALRAAAVGREQDLIALYDRLPVRGVAAPQLIAAVRAEHAVHLAALTAPPPGQSPTPSRSPTPSPPPSRSPTVAPTGPPTPTLPAPTVADLRAAETAAQVAHAAGVTGSSKALAQLLATLSASEAAHAVALA